MQRVLQLLAKTNQFNLTTRRYTESDLDRLKRQGATIVSIQLEDKYTTPEIIGVIILLPPAAKDAPVTIDTFLLSCRVLGRTIETAVLGWVCACASRAGFIKILGLFSPTDRNMPASTVYRDHGFVEAEPGHFLLDLKARSVATPDWFRITQDQTLIED